MKFHFKKALNEKEEELRLILFKEEETLKEKEKNLWLEREDWIKSFKEHLQQKEDEMRTLLEKKEEESKQQLRDKEEDLQKYEIKLLEEKDNIITTIKNKDDEINAFKVNLALKEAELSSSISEKESTARQIQEGMQAKIYEFEKIGRKNVTLGLQI